jgi:hypothetical protein
MMYFRLAFHFQAVNFTPEDEGNVLLEGMAAP